MKSFRNYLTETEDQQHTPSVGDPVGIEIGFDNLIETYVVDVLDDGIVLQGDDTTLKLLEESGCVFERIARYGPVGNSNGQGWTRTVGEDTSSFGHELDLIGKQAELDPVEPVGEAEYQGREVSLNKPMAGDVKKSKVYVKNAKGNVVKVNFGDPNMKIKKSNPARRRSFRARHNCENPGPKTSARYWSCRAW
jgi:hypothetical protein